MATTDCAKGKIIFNEHMFPYVLSSMPQTGAYSNVHAMTGLVVCHPRNIIFSTESEFTQAGVASRDLKTKSFPSAQIISSTESPACP